MTRVLTAREFPYAALGGHLPGRRLGCGQLAGRERAGDRATLFYTPFERLPAAAERELRDEGAGLVRFMEPEAGSYSSERSAADSR